MDPDTGHGKKDKRLLVLLAFGALIILLNLNWSPRHHNQSARFYWLELGEVERPVYRSSSPEQIVSFCIPQEKNHSAVPDNGTTDAMTEVLVNNKLVAAIMTPEKILTLRSGSPRLSFFLGQPLPINRAGFKELVLIPGIGPALAEKIIDYRQNNGPIGNKRMLTAVHGIGQRKASRFAPFFSFE